MEKLRFPNGFFSIHLGFQLGNVLPSKVPLQKGESAEPYVRLDYYNKGLSRYTKGKGPWILVYLEEFPNRSAALAREKMLKRQNRSYLLWLISQPSNLLK